MESAGALMGLSSIFVMGNSLLLQLEGPQEVSPAEASPERHQQRSRPPAEAPSRPAKGLLSVNPAGHVSSLWQQACSSAAGLVRP